MIIGGAVVNALAFTGGNYLLSLLGKSDEAEKERKRHDLAIEALQRAESEYQHKRRLRLDYLNNFVLSNTACRCSKMLSWRRANIDA